MQAVSFGIFLSAIFILSQSHCFLMLFYYDRFEYFLLLLLHVLIIFPLSNEKSNITVQAHRRRVCPAVVISISEIDMYAHGARLATHSHKQQGTEASVLYFTHSLNVKYLQIKMSTHISLFFCFFFVSRFRLSLFSLLSICYERRAHREQHFLSVSISFEYFSCKKSFSKMCARARGLERAQKIVMQRKASSVIYKNVFLLSRKFSFRLRLSIVNIMYCAPHVDWGCAHSRPANCESQFPPTDFDA